MDETSTNGAGPDINLDPDLALKVFDRSLSAWLGYESMQIAQNQPMAYGYPAYGTTAVPGQPLTNRQLLVLIGAGWLIWHLAKG
jgi:hypothetical protein